VRGDPAGLEDMATGAPARQAREIAGLDRRGRRRGPTTGAGGSGGRGAEPLAKLTDRPTARRGARPV